MAWFSQIRRSLAVLVHRDRFARDLEEEMRSHLELQAQDNRKNGMAAREAEHAARRQFGNAALLRELSRDTWGWGWLERLAQDIAFSLRVLRKRPGFTAIAVIILALGSGANTAIFTVVNAMLLRPLPFPQPDRLVYLGEANRQKGLLLDWVAPGNYLEWRERTNLLADIGVFDPVRATLTGAGEPVRLNGVQASATLLTTLGINPILGRTFTSEEDRPGKNSVVMLGENLWRGRFGARTDILGKTIQIASRPFTIVGVVPDYVRLDADAWDLWTPLGLGPEARDTHTGFSVHAIGRMKSGVTISQVRREMRSIGAIIYSEYKGLGPGWEVETDALSDRLMRRTRPQLLLLTGAVGLLLLIACGNVANLLWMRSAQRNREIAIRAALGAGRWRIVRQLLTESIVLSSMAGAAGLLIAYGSVHLLYEWMPESMQTGIYPKVDPTVLVFTLAVSMATGFLFGLLPALNAGRIRLVESLKEARGGGSLSRGGLAGAFVVVQAVLAVVLLTGAGLLIRSFREVLAVDMGFQPERLLTFQVPLSSKYQDAARVAFYEGLIERVRNLPGVRHVGGSELLPLDGGGANVEFAVEGHPFNGLGEFVGTRIVTPGYFQAMGIPLLRGRVFEAHDDQNAAEVAVINHTMAITYWPGDDPVGKRFKLNPRYDSPWITVVGVVHNTKHFALDGKNWPEAFFPQRQRGWPTMRLVVRTSGDPLGLIPAIRTVISSMDPNVPMADVRTMDRVVGDSVAPRRLSMIVLACFAGLALLLASIGLYGVLAFSVVQRRHELGVRMALGAKGRDVLAMLLRRGMWLTLAGLVSGMAASIAVTRLLSDMIFGIRLLDPVTYAFVSVMVLTTAAVAILIPARRAARIDPMEALRYE